MQGCSSSGERGEEAEEVEEVEEVEDEGSREIHRERWALRAVVSMPEMMMLRTPSVMSHK
jgi:hypothetical protein